MGLSGPLLLSGNSLQLKILRVLSLSKEKKKRAYYKVFIRSLRNRILLLLNLHSCSRMLGKDGKCLEK